MSERDELMERACAAKAIIGTINNNDERRIGELIAFMAIIEGRSITRLEAMEMLDIKR